MDDEAGAVLVAKATNNVRLTAEADRMAEIASGYAGESKSQYVSRVVIEAARRDIARGHEALSRELAVDAEAPPPPKPPHKKGR
jgi:hypothetical protein